MALTLYDVPCGPLLGVTDRTSCIPSLWSDVVVVATKVDDDAEDVEFPPPRGEPLMTKAAMTAATIAIVSATNT